MPKFLQALEITMEVIILSEVGQRRPLRSAGSNGSGVVDVVGAGELEGVIRVPSVVDVVRTPP